jgi:hypothetical protein
MLSCRPGLAGRRQLLDGLGASPPTGKTYAVPCSIASDCSTDVTAPLAKCVAPVPDNSTLTLGKGACYQVEGSGPAITWSSRAVA